MQPRPSIISLVEPLLSNEDKDSQKKPKETPVQTQANLFMAKLGVS